MGAATSQSAILGNLGLKGSVQAEVGQKDRNQGTDSVFLSILESVSGSMVVPLGSHVLQPDKGSKKPTQHLAVDSVKQAKVGLPIGSSKYGAVLDSKPGPVGGSMERRESSGTKQDVANGSAAKHEAASVSQFDSIAAKDAPVGPNAQEAVNASLTSGSDLKNSAVPSHLVAELRTGAREVTFPGVQTFLRSDSPQPHSAKPDVHDNGKALNVAQFDLVQKPTVGGVSVAQIPLQMKGETGDLQVEPLQTQSAVEMQNRELSKLNGNTDSAKPVRKLFAPLQVQLASNFQGTVSDPIVPGFAVSSQSDLNTSGKISRGNMGTAPHIGTIDYQVLTPLHGELKSQLPVSNGKMAQETNQTGTMIGKKDLPIHDAMTGNANGVDMNPFATLHMHGSQPVHGGAQSANHVTTLDTTQPNWTSNFGQIVSHVSSDNGGTIQVKVHPEGMGDLLISVSQSTAGLQIHVEANQLSTAQWLGQQTGQLTNAVSQLGISVANVQVGFGQATLGQPGNGHSNRKSGDGERQVRSVTGLDESSSSSLLTEQSTLSLSMPVYSQGSSISLHA